MVAEIVTDAAPASSIAYREMVEPVLLSYRTVVPVPPVTGFTLTVEANHNAITKSFVALAIVQVEGLLPALITLEALLIGVV